MLGTLWIICVATIIVPTIWYIISTIIKDVIRKED
jgi:hypothetical protein